VIICITLFYPEVAMIFYDYFRSSAGYRVRIALNLKNIVVERRPVSLINNANHHPDFIALNPQGFVPLLIDGDGAEKFQLTQSMAIIEYLEERFPTPALLPDSLQGRATARALALVLACDVHPLNNKRILDYLSAPLALSKESKAAWTDKWISDGLRAFEAQLLTLPVNAYCLGNTPGIADIFLIPQLASAQRFSVDLSPYPRCMAVYAHAMQHPAFDAAQPMKQADAI
jgi:maleylacetoacetate isomerase